MMRNELINLELRRLRTLHDVLEVMPGLFHRLRPSVVQRADVRVKALAVCHVRAEEVVGAWDAQEVLVAPRDLDLVDLAQEMKSKSASPASSHALVPVARAGAGDGAGGGAGDGHV
jgi:hypothetical protein